MKQSRHSQVSRWSIITSLCVLAATGQKSFAAIEKSERHQQPKEIYSATEGAASTSETHLNSDDSDDLDSLSLTSSSPKSLKARSSTTGSELHSAPPMEPSRMTQAKSGSSESDELDNLNDSSRPPAPREPVAEKTPPSTDELDQLDSIHEAPKTEPDSASQNIASKPTNNDPRLKERIDSLEKEITAMRTQNVAKSAGNPSKSPVADLVPDDQKATLIKRLRLVETLIREHGLAYDYKTLTTQQLENLVAQLHSKD